MSIIWVFDNIENKHTLYREEDYMKKFCTSLREHTTNVIDSGKKKMLPLTKEELKSYQDSEAWKRVITKFTNDENYQNVRNHCHFTCKYGGAAHSICNLKFNVSNEIPVFFHNSSNYDDHFMIKELANEFEKQFECLGENKEKCKSFSVSIDKDGNESEDKIYVQDLWQVNYQILLIISQNKFIKLSAKIVFLNMKVSRTIW